MIDPIVSLDAAERLAADPDRRTVFADVRWYLDGRPGRAAFESGHLPDAVFVDLDRDLAAHNRPPTEGRHPFPTAFAFAASLSALGIGNSDTVIAYDDTGGMTAGRLAWMLRIIGQDAAVLDGGLRAFTGLLETGPGRAPRPTDRAAIPWPAHRLATADQTAELASSSGVAGGAVVLDARSPERFRGEETAAIDSRVGHIPGARNAPWAANLDADTQTFRNVWDLADHYGALGVRAETAVVCSCGSGVSACADLIALEHIGVRNTRLFVASWSGWSADPSRNVSVGPA